MPSTQTENDKGGGPGGHPEPHTVTIIVNTRDREVPRGDISFEQVVALAFESPPYGENTLFTVTYRRGHGNRPEGTLTPGETVRTKEGMIFNVTATDRS
jgi:hypothetical protein